MLDFVPTDAGFAPDAGSRLDVRLIEVLDDEDDFFGILGRLAILLTLGALGRMLERDKLEAVVTTGVLETGAVVDVVV